MPAAVTVQMSDAEIAALDRHIAAHRPGCSREQIVLEIISAWVKAQPHADDVPDEGLRPEELNASNDS